MAFSTAFTQCAPETTKFGKITQIKGHFAVQGHSRSLIFVPIESSYTASYIKTISSSGADSSWFFSKRQRITLRLLYAISRPSVVCRLSVTLVHPTQAIELFGNFSPYDSPRTLLFWCQKSLVGDAPFPLKFAFKVTHPLSNSKISTNIGS